MYLVDQVYVLQPQAQICINCTLTEKFSLYRGCRQGCPLSTFLFNLAIEPFPEAIRSSKEIFGIDIGKTENRISLYANDIVLYLTSTERSIQAVLDLIDKFGRVSGYKIHLAKSNAFIFISIETQDHLTLHLGTERIQVSGGELVSQT